MSKVLLIIPAYNEEESLRSLIEEIKTVCSGMDYLVVNDCSSDGTDSLLSELGANYITLPCNMGIGGAVQSGYRYAAQNGYDIAIQIDGDGQHDVRFVKDMVKLIEDKQADVVIGSRFIDKEGFQSSQARRLGIRILSMLIRLMCGAMVKDVTSGFRAVNRRFIELFAEAYPDDYPEPEVIVTAKLYGAKIKEVPVVMRERTTGKSSINLKRSVYYMIKVSLAIIICRISLGFRR